MVSKNHIKIEFVTDNQKYTVMSHKLIRFIFIYYRIEALGWIARTSGSMNDNIARGLTWLVPSSSRWALLSYHPRLLLHRYTQRISKYQFVQYKLWLACGWFRGNCGIVEILETGLLLLLLLPHRIILINLLLLLLKQDRITPTMFSSCLLIQLQCLLIPCSNHLRRHFLVIIITLARLHKCCWSTNAAGGFVPS